MPILNWPAGLVPANIELSLITKAQTFESDLNGSLQTVALPGDRWTGNLAFSNVTGTQANTFRAFLASLRGITGRFYLPAFDKPTPSGTALGAPLVKGASQSGSSLLTDGWEASQAAVLKAGDYIQVGNELKIITADAASDGTGNATLQIAPPLRVSPADNAAIITTNPATVMALADPAQVRWAQQPGRIYAISLAVVEPLDI